MKKQGKSNILIIVFYADDLVFIGNNKKIMDELKNEVMKKYETSDIGLLHHFLGIRIHQNDGGVFICKKKYAKNIFFKKLNVWLQINNCSFCL